MRLLRRSISVFSALLLVSACAALSQDYSDELDEIQRQLVDIWNVLQFGVRDVDLYDVRNNTQNTYLQLRNGVVPALRDVVDEIANADVNAASSWSEWGARFDEWSDDQSRQFAAITNTLSGLVSALTNSVAGAGGAVISNLVDNWSAIGSVDGWDIRGEGLTLEAFLSEWLSEWNRSFYSQTPPVASGPPFQGEWALLNWWGSAGQKPTGPSEVMARYSFADWIADAFRFQWVNGSNMVVDSVRPYSTDELSATSTLGWDTNITSRSITPDDPSELFPTDSQSQLESADAQLATVVQEAISAPSGSGVGGRLVLSDSVSVFGASIPEFAVDLDNPRYRDILGVVRRVFTVFWAILGVVANVAFVGHIWEHLTQL